MRAEIAEVLGDGPFCRSSRGDGVSHLHPPRCAMPWFAYLRAQRAQLLGRRTAVCACAASLQPSFNIS